MKERKPDGNGNQDDLRPVNGVADGGIDARLPPAGAGVIVQDLRELTKSVNKFVEGLQHLVEVGGDVARKYIDNKREGEQAEREYSERRHKRASWILAGVLGAGFVFVMTALILKQYQLVMYALASGLALAAGAGLTRMFGGPDKTPPKSEK